eukprot:TRINITY_DN17829_c0_g1_i1.p1 TRINITY_DN17829_c0_g1~~TRINITY_DN17829_c0_g1_i1.p1  ORF type:complete len:161 (-),score=48.10 TRINITY_DN17829_c0_g1_i1:64-525(-)
MKCSVAIFAVFALAVVASATIVPHPFPPIARAQLQQHQQQQERRGLAAGEDVWCDGCKTVIGAVDVWLRSNNTVTEIEKYLDTLCGLFDDTDFEPVCDQILNYSLETIIAWLEQEYPPSWICQKIGICAAPAFLPPLPAPAFQLPLAPKANAN